MQKIAAKRFNHRVHRGHGVQAVCAWASQAGAAFSNPFTIELAQDCEIASLTHFASSPAWQRNCRGLRNENGLRTQWSKRKAQRGEEIDKIIVGKIIGTTEGAAHRTTGQQGSEEKAENLKDSSRKIKKMRIWLQFHSETPL